MDLSYSEGITKTFFYKRALEAFFAIDALDEPYRQNVGKQTPGSVSHSRNLVQSFVDMGLLEEFEKDDHKKLLRYTEEGQDMYDSLRDEFGFEPEGSLV